MKIKVDYKDDPLSHKPNLKLTGAYLVTSVGLQ